MSAEFVHLRLHSEYSLVDGLVKIKPLMKALAAMNMPAVALTDQSNFYALVKFYNSAMGSGIKPICGADMWVENIDPSLEPTKMLLLVAHEPGYLNLTELISKGYQIGQIDGRAIVKREWVKEHSEGLIALSGAREGEVGQALINDDVELATAYLREWRASFGDRFYLEIQRTGRKNDETHVHRAVALGSAELCPVVATNDVMFLKQDDFLSHETRVCIAEGCALDDSRREKLYSEQQYLRSPEEMAELFADIPQALENSVEIAKRCTIDVQLGTYFLPDFPVPDDFDDDPYFKVMPYAQFEEWAVAAMAETWAGKEDTDDYRKNVRVNIFFQKISYEGLDFRLESILDKSAEDYLERKQPYLDRLRFELDIIMVMGFPGYFLIVMDFIQWAKDQDIPVGPGRGSGAGSLVAYAQLITDLDPLEYDLLFERFLNPERVSMPDFDVDFCMDKRIKVIEYVSEHYGREAVSQIITFGTMAAKAVVRDVARAQGKSFGLADKLSKMIPFEVGMTLGRAIEEEPSLKEFIETDEQAGEIWEMAIRLEGTVRNVGKHAGGVVIAPTKITDFSAIYSEEAGAGLVTMFDKNDVEDAGLVKFDFLGLRTLTIIDWALKMINPRLESQGKEIIDIAAIPLEDKPTYKLLQAAQTTAVFQLESRGMKDLIKRLQPDNLEDMIALVALFRPGPLDSGMVDDFVNRKHGRAEVAYPDAQYQHELLEPILKPTYGVIVYQEQVMQIAQELAGYSLGGADMLRRAMGKKKPEEMAKQRSVFKDGAISVGVDPDLAMKIFDLVEKFAGYGFNKSHSAAYALVSYQTAWLKAHYPSQFMAATMSSDMDKTDKVVIFIEECRSMGLTLLPPDVNNGEFMFTVDEEDRIIYGLGAVKGLGEGPVDAIVAARADGGPFIDLFDFCARVDAKSINKRVLEALIRSGAVDSLAPPVAAGEKVDLNHSRAILKAAMNDAMKAATQSAQSSMSGHDDMFGELVPAGESHVYDDFLTQREWSDKERLKGEKDTLGLYLTGHPIDQYEREIRQFIRNRVVDIKPDRSAQMLCGLVIATRAMKTKSGSNMGFVTLDDKSGRIEITLMGEAFGLYQHLMIKDTIVFVEGEVRNDDYSGGLKVVVRRMFGFIEAREIYSNGMNIALDEQSCKRGFDQQLEKVLQAHPGKVPVSIAYQRKDARGQLQLSDAWKVAPSDELLETLCELYGRQAAKLSY